MSSFSQKACVILLKNKLEIKIHEWLNNIYLENKHLMCRYYLYDYIKLFFDNDTTNNHNIKNILQQLYNALQNKPDKIIKDDIIRHFSYIIYNGNDILLNYLIAFFDDSQFIISKETKKQLDEIEKQIIQTNI
jgi:hypothetical protein